MKRGHSFKEGYHQGLIRYNFYKNVPNTAALLRKSWSHLRCKLEMSAAYPYRSLAATFHVNSSSATEKAS